MPHAKKIESKEKIYELRFNDNNGIIRILYFFFDGNNIIFTNAFVKKRQKTPKKEIEIAISRKKLFLTRNSSKKAVKVHVKKKKNK
jgi:phage-related protein